MSIPTRNSFQRLSNLEERISSKGDPRNSPPDAMPSQRSRTARRSQQKKKILFLADSHGRYCGEKLQNSLGNSYEVCTIFKPNAKLEQVIEDVENLTKNFSLEDTVIIQAGTNGCFSFAIGVVDHG